MHRCARAIHGLPHSYSGHRSHTVKSVFSDGSNRLVFEFFLHVFGWKQFHRVMLNMAKDNLSAVLRSIEHRRTDRFVSGFIATIPLWDFGTKFKLRWIICYSASSSCSIAASNAQITMISRSSHLHYVSACIKVWHGGLLVTNLQNQKRFAMALSRDDLWEAASLSIVPMSEWVCNT